MNKMNRRKILHGMATGAGATFGSALLPGFAQAAAVAKGISTTGSAGAPKRVIFFLQNQGFDPATCVPSGLKESVSLEGVTLPEPISPLEPYKHKIHIINGPASGT